MNCVNGHSVMDNMKFCPVCGVLVSADKKETEAQPKQGEFAAVYTPPKLPELNIKSPKKLVIGALVFVVFAAFVSAGGDSSEDSSSTSTSSSTQDQSSPTLDEQSALIIRDEYLPLNYEMTAKFAELADYAFAEDAQSLISGCEELKALAETGLSLTATGIPKFDQAWNDAMESGLTASNYCIAGDFDTSSLYIVQMGDYLESSLTYLE